MDFYVAADKKECPKCKSVEIVKIPTNHDNVKDCFCGKLDANGNLIKSQCEYEWKEHP